MADTKKGRNKQARDAENRQRERELTEARDRGDETEPPADDADEDRRVTDDAPRECHRRGCSDRATFSVLERYQEDSGHGAVEATAVLCRTHTAEESPVNLEGAYEEYVFRVEPLSETEIEDAES